MHVSWQPTKRSSVLGEQATFTCTTYNIISSLHIIISYHIIRHHTSCHIISLNIIHHIISYHIISYHIISYHIISYHIISYHIISYLRGSILGIGIIIIIINNSPSTSHINPTTLRVILYRYGGYSL